MKGKRIVAALLLLSFSGLLYISARWQMQINGQEKRIQKAVTITWFVAQEGYAKSWNPKENLADAKILENTGVNLEITSGSLTDLDALMATDTLPDLITVEVDAPERTVLENTGMVEPLEPLFAQYAPNINIPDSMKEWYRNDNGNWYSIISYYYGPERVNKEFGGYLGVVHNNNYVRADLMEELGADYETLLSKESVLEILRKAKGLTYQGQQVIPYSGWYTQNIAEQFGMKVEDEKGNFLSMYRQPEWLEALLFGNQMYREGLMVAEEFTESDSQRLKQVQAGKVFFCTGYANIKDASNYLYSKDHDAYMDYAGHITGDAGNTPNLKSVSSGGWTATLVRKDADNMEQIVRFIDYMVSDAGTLNAAPGIGAQTYDIVDGKLVMKESVVKEYENDYQKAMAKYYPNLEFFVDWTIVQKYQSTEEKEAHLQQYEGCNIYDSKASDAAMMIDGNRAMSEMKAQIDAYYEQAEVEIITSKSAEECVQKYEETLAEMDRLGLRKLETYEKELYQKAKARLP